MIKCKACGNLISKTARSCPQCGRKVRRTRLLTWIVGGVFAVIIFNIVFTSNRQDQKQEKSPPVSRQKSSKERIKSPEELRKEKIERHFSLWNGSHRGLTRFIKNAMNDPRSYEHVETSYIDKGDYLKVKTTFRGKNMLGGIVKNWIWAKVDLEGNVVEVISQGP